MEDYRLYILKQCPFCKKVLRFMEKNDINIEILDIEEGKNRDELEKLGGMVQVPALRMGDKIMYESGDIIKYFKENL